MPSHSPTARDRLDRLLPALLVGALAWLLYAATAAPGLTWAHDGADGGDLIAATMTWGVPHPSGYPSYCLLGRLFALLPLGSISRRMNLFSATAAAASVVLIYLSCVHLLSHWLGRQHRRDALFSAGAALAYAAGPTLWSQATIAEVYALAALCFSLCLYLALCAGSPQPSTSDTALPTMPGVNRARPRRHAPELAWAALGLAVGVGLGAHLTLALALPGLALVLWPRRTWRRLIALLAAGLLGLLVYLYLPLAAAARPPVNWGDASTWSGFVWLVSGRYYRHYAFGLPLRYLPTRLGAWGRLWGQQFLWIGLAPVLVGLWSWWENRRRRWLAATLVTFALYSLYAITYDTTDSYVYLIPTYAITALWLAEGLRAIGAGFLAAGGAPTRGWAIAALLLALALPVALVVQNYHAMNLRDDSGASDWVDATLQILPPGALLITGEDGQTFALDYACWVEGRCRDLVVVDGELLSQPWYRGQLARRYPGLSLAQGDGSILRWVQDYMPHGRVFISSARPELEASYQIIPRGGLWEIVAQK
jgi:hypothetical protein